MLSTRFDEALLFASRLHRAQLRKATRVPYIAHLLAVAALVTEDGGGEDEAIAALLHDSIEDQGDDYPGGRDALRGHIHAHFGAEVLEIVNACTDDDMYGCSTGGKDDPAAWRPRKQAYVDRIPRLEAAALRVSCADKLHNARSLLADYREYGETLWSRFRTKSGDDQLWYYESLVLAFGGTGRLAGELARVVAQLKAERRARLREAQA
jgi:(p)ppGpp synthase/HD superfamily hydrolase